MNILMNSPLCDFCVKNLLHTLRVSPRGHSLISPTEGEADRTLHGFGSQDKGSAPSGYFSTILLPPPQVDQIPAAQP